MRTFRRILLIVSLVSLTGASHASAQYIYLDTNGNGVHDSADLVSGSGPTTVDVWLNTSLNRNGSPGACPSGGWNSYEVILPAVGGTVTSWGDFTPLNRGTLCSPGLNSAGYPGRAVFGPPPSPPSGAPP